jgi:peptidoglycan/LPS O-acetylase OafA/YrhL
MAQPNTPGALPLSIKLAAALFVIYGVAVVLNAAIMQSAAGWLTARDIPRAFIRLFGAGLIAWGLLHRARWAWWLGLIVALLWLAAGVMTLFVLERGDVYWLPPSGFQAFLVVSFLSLGLAIALLLSPAAREAFRRPAA